MNTLRSTWIATIAMSLLAPPFASAQEAEKTKELERNRAKAAAKLPPRVRPGGLRDRPAAVGRIAAPAIRGVAPAPAPAAAPGADRAPAPPVAPPPAPGGPLAAP